MDTIKLFLVEDHLLVRSGIKALFDENQQINVIGEASDGYELFEKIKETIPDIIIMDISLPKLSGIEIAKILKKDYPEIKILILSMHTSEDFIFNAIKAGVNGYLPKTATRDELIQALNEIQNGKEFFSKPIAD
jgi:DNA-binding NarL/FixJ family response regulator